ncbi:hypothetical protein IW261DRAFT_1144167 [Armillaria novae-zelandiae]|uniref:Uncharacterized protein n=1 Tax=Armillaria novae-zelandiae TaxID=153914 RepID=A0AA39PAV9_9AGAR|nr:hypothetical protein IW261DRAFT_1144167 [Armillaria novae-zelandiae]
MTCVSFPALTCYRSFLLVAPLCSRNNALAAARRHTQIMKSSVGHHTIVKICRPGGLGYRLAASRTLQYLLRASSLRISACFEDRLEALPLPLWSSTLPGAFRLFCAISSISWTYSFLSSTVTGSFAGLVPKVSPRRIHTKASPTHGKNAKLQI